MANDLKPPILPLITNELNLHLARRFLFFTFWLTEFTSKKKEKEKIQPHVKSPMRQLCKVRVKNVYTSLERIFPKCA